MPCTTASPRELLILVVNPIGKLNQLPPLAHARKEPRNRHGPLITVDPIGPRAERTSTPAVDKHGIPPRTVQLPVFPRRAPDSPICHPKTFANNEILNLAIYPAPHYRTIAPHVVVFTRRRTSCCPEQAS